MVMTPSQMLELGTPLPEFTLADPDGNEHTPATVAKDAKGTLVVFMCNHCPFVKHVREELAKLGRDCKEQGVAMFGINSNDYDTYPDDSPARMKDESETFGYVFPYLVDAEQSVAKLFQAACTPDFFLFDGDGKLAYRGQLDRSRPSNEVPVTGDELRAAIEAVVGGKPVSAEQTPSIGCNIKWRAGNAPEWFG